MKYIGCARYFEEQNIVSQQEGTEIFYKAIKVKHVHTFSSYARLPHGNFKGRTFQERVTEFWNILWGGAIASGRKETNLALLPCSQQSLFVTLHGKGRSVRSVPQFWRWICVALVHKTHNVQSYILLQGIEPGEELLTWYEKIPMRKKRGRKKKITGLRNLLIKDAETTTQRAKQLFMALQP